MSDIGGAEPLDFDYGTAESVATAFTNAASTVEGQTGSRASYVATALTDFRGRFSELFTTNASTASTDAGELATRLREVAGWADQLAESAREEDARRRRAREWQERHDSRNGWEQVGDFLFGEEEMPREPVGEAPTFAPAVLDPGTRETPPPGTGGGEGGTSSARPDDLRSFATGTSGLNAALAGLPGTLRGKLADFAAQCKWGTLRADGLVTGFERWSTANDADVTWANTVATAFEQAGSASEVSTLSDSALLAALQAAGVSAGRDDLAIEPAQAYGMPPTTGYSNDPVNTSTGNFLETETDLAFAGASTSLRVSRTYNSLSDAVGVFGPGWASVLETRLELDDEGATVTLADGRALLFPRLGDGWDHAVGENHRLAVEGDALVVREPGGTWWRFTPTGTWTASGGGAGTVVEAARDADGLVTRLSHARGRWITVDHVDGRVAVLTGSDGRRVEYAYDDHGRLVGATTEVGTRSYAWNDAGLVESVTSASGVVEAHNAYDDRGRVTTQLTPHGRTVRFAYLPGRVTVVSDADGSRSNSWIADAKGRLVGVLDSDDRRQSMSYDARGDLVSVVERDGSVTVHGYDERGRRVRTVTPSGADLTWGWDEHDRVTTVVTEQGAVVTYEYPDDVQRDPSVVVDPEGGRSELHWADGLLVRVVDPTGVTVTCRHDEHGDLVETENALGDVARIERDRAGRPVRAVSPSGAVTEYTYDAAGLLASRRDADGAVWRFEHGPGARLTAVVDPLGARTELAYGVHGDLESTTDALGRVVTRRLDDQGLLRSLELPDGAAWTFAHDALSRLRGITDPTGATWTREHDATGAVTALVDPTGVRQDVTTDPADGTTTLRDAFSTTTLHHDEFGRPTTSASADGTSELTSYDRCGRPVELVDGEGGLTRLERDAAGRVVAVVSPTGARTTYEHDACGRPSASVDPLGARTTLTYDADSRVVARTLPTGEVERLTYDAVGRVVRRRTPGLGEARYRYDLAGRLTGTQDVRHGRREFRYDAAGQLVEAVDGLGGVTRYSYDERGRVATVTDPLGGVTRRTYDAADRVVALTDPLGRTTTATYDAAGRQLTQTDPDGHVVGWSYDAAGREAGTSVDGRPLSTIRRDVFSRTVVVTDHTRGDGADVDHELSFDRCGRLVRRARGGSAVSWEHDADGRRTARVSPDGTRVEYRRDAAGRVVEVVDGTGPTATFRHDASGRLVGSTSGDLLQTWRHDDGLLVEHVVTDADGVRATRIERDEAGRISRVDGADGSASYVYDEALQLVGVRHDDGTGSAWEYDGGGRLVREDVAGTERRFSYDAAGQLVAVETAGGGRTEFVHDGLGRRVREIAADGGWTEYAWNGLGYLSGVTTLDADSEVTGRTRLWVDVLGELAAVDGVETWWDTAARVPALVAVGDHDVLTLPGGVTRVGGVDLEPGWRAARTTDAGDPWGAGGASSSAGPAGGDLAAAGLVLPGGASLTASGGLSLGGLDWLGARAYDPATRGFLSVDPLAPVTAAAWSANPYSYAGNDPLQALDPLGLRPVTDAELDSYAHANQGAFSAVGEWWGDNWEYVVAGVAIVGGVALMATGVGGPAGVALLAASGALLSGGISVASQKATTGEVDWGRVGVDAAVGAATGLVTAGGSAVASAVAPRASAAVASVAGRAASSVANMGGRAGSAIAAAGSRAVSAVGSAASSQLGMSVIANGTVGAVGNAATYAVIPPDGETRTLQGFAASAAGGFVSGSLSAVGGHQVQAMSRPMQAFFSPAAGGVTNVMGTVTDNAIAGRTTDPLDVGVSLATGAGLSYMPGAEAVAGSATPSLVQHFGTAYAGQHAAWMADSTTFVLEETEVLPRG